LGYPPVLWAILPDIISSFASYKIEREFEGVLPSTPNSLKGAPAPPIVPGFFFFSSGMSDLLST
jgi:hypothetical protein